MEKDQYTFDVIVHENHILEVARGRDVTVAQAYGEDWSAAPYVQYHPVVKPEPKKYEWKPTLVMLLYTIPALIFIAIGVVKLFSR